jgi:hypothetical protein
MQGRHGGVGEGGLKMEGREELIMDNGELWGCDWVIFPAEIIGLINRLKVQLKALWYLLLKARDSPQSVLSSSHLVGEIVVKMEGSPIKPSDLAFIRGTFSTNKPNPCSQTAKPSPS